MVISKFQHSDYRYC